MSTVRRKGAAHHIPANKRDQAFCKAWLEHYDIRRAYQEAGFSTKGGNWDRNARAKIARFMPYLKPLQEAKSKQVGTQLAVKQGDVLETMKAIGFVNLKDYYVKSDKVLMRKIPIPGKPEEFTLEPVMFQGRPVQDMEPIPLSELTREQALAVEPTYMFGRLIGYTLPSAKVRHQYLHSLGQNLGLWLDDKDKGPSSAVHLHAHAHFESIPSAKLDALQKQLIGAVGAEFARTLGLTQEEIDEAIEAPTGG